MSKLKNKVIAITLGDPQGVGGEVIVKALKRPEICNAGRFVLIGDAQQLKQCRGANITLVDVPYRNPGQGALKFLDRAIELLKGGVVDALVTAPLSKERVSRYAKDFVGHTEYLAQAFGVKNFDMMFVADKVRLSIATRHLPLKKVPQAINKKLVMNSIALMDKTLREQFAVKRPRIAVLGLNPHAGEGGLLGSEEQKQIIPAIKEAIKRGINATGPYPADTFFIKDKGFDGIIAMYHDQGLAPIKGMYFKDLVNFTAGLPFVRTSPVHGTAFDIAGRNIADPSSMVAAIKLAVELT